MKNQIIKSIIARKISSDAKIWLFGSRTDDNRSGGDIDLFVETRTGDPTVILVEEVE
jgi:predicted nucleotidyltransferase